MRFRVLLTALAAAALLGPMAQSYHSAGNGIVATSVTNTFTTPLATPVWWDYSVVRGVPTGVQERNAMFELRNPAPAVIEAITLPPGLPTVSQCLPVTTPQTVAPAVVVHQISCVRENGFSVQVHYFPWSIDPDDPDHVISPTLGTPTAPLEWHVDGVPLSYKTAVIPAGHWQVWIDPAIAPPVAHSIRYSVSSNSAFYYDFLGFRGCVFYAQVAPGVGDEALLGCPRGYV